MRVFRSFASSLILVGCLSMLALPLLAEDVPASSPTPATTGLTSQPAAPMSLAEIEKKRSTDCRNGAYMGEFWAKARWKEIGWLGVVAFAIAEDEPSAAHFVNKTPEYVQAFRIAYKGYMKKVRNQTCCVFGGLFGCSIGIAIFAFAMAALEPR